MGAVKAMPFIEADSEHRLGYALASDRLDVRAVGSNSPYRPLTFPYLTVACGSVKRLFTQNGMSCEEFDNPRPILVCRQFLETFSKAGDHSV
jgi:hypothetical protein